MIGKFNIGDLVDIEDHITRKEMTKNWNAVGLDKLGPYMVNYVDILGNKFRIGLQGVERRTGGFVAFNEDMFNMSK